ncbi:hypothetical protein ID866_1416 [Astraeus odoratus]|nr:hypothetical protein ID866_1416 [Astraeus odoratus]
MPSATIPATYVNPAQMSQDQQADPAPSKRRASSTGKRRRAPTPDESGDSSSQPARKNRDGPKKKKANRACAHCQKAHLTCDDSRPCQRCIKRGMANCCVEGHRKKAKYLLDDDELEQLKKKQSAPKEEQEPVPIPAPPPEPFSANDPLFNITFDPNFAFGSEAANLEYSILSAILGNPSPPDSANAPSPQPPIPSGLQSSTWSPEPLHAQPQYSQSGTTNPYSSGFGDHLPVPPSDTALTTSQSSPSFISTYSPTQGSTDLQYPPSYDQVQASQVAGSTRPVPPRYARDVVNSAPAVMVRAPSKETGSQSLVSSSHTSPSPANSTHANSSDHHSPLNVTAPYDYTEGYHFLMKHLPTRFEKNDILRIVRALAIFRPSLIALQMPMSEEDEVFVEKCFQRSLLELEKLISYSGTPTVVWRRTGEICLVAPEFCMLTEWSIDELVGKRKYIYELFENQSVVEYWENFATHAFENTTKSVYSHCVLLKPSGAPIPATFCFSIRRDIFDLPNIVIGALVLPPSASDPLISSYFVAARWTKRRLLGVAVADVDHDDMTRHTLVLVIAGALSLCGNPSNRTT